MFSVYHDQKDGSEFSDVTLASEDDNENSDVIVVRIFKNFSEGEYLQEAVKCNIDELTAILLDILHCKASCRSSTLLNFSNFLSTITSELSLSSSDTRVTSENSLPSLGHDVLKLS